MPKPKKSQPEKLNEYGLTIAEEQFCHEYLIDLNQTQAYKRVHPNAKDSSAAVEASKSLRKPKVQRRIQELNIERQKRTDINADQVLLALAQGAFLNFGHYATWDKAGNVEITPHGDLTEDQRAGIKKLKKVTRTIPTGKGEPIIEERVELELRGQEKNLEMLGRHLNLFHEGPQSQMIINYNFPATNRQKPNPAGSEQ